MRKLFLTILAFFFLTGFVFSQTDVPSKYAETITQQDLKKQLMIVASAEMEGRKTGTEGQRKAAAYIESQFKNIGLKAPESLMGYRQYYPLLKDTLIPKSLKIGNLEFEYEKDYVLLSGSSKKEQFTSKKIIFCGYGIEDKSYNDYKGKAVKGKVVLILSGEPQVNGKYLVSGTEERSLWAYSMTKKAATAKKNGAIAVLFVNTTWDSIPSAMVKNTGKNILYFPGSKQPAKLTVALMSPVQMKKILDENVANKILQIAKIKGPLNQIDVTKKTKTKLTFKKTTTQAFASNVIGIVEGTDKKDEYVFLTAHYDHLGKNGEVIYFGADDDGSGTVSVIEMAEAFARAKKDGHGPRRTVVFMTVSGEEEGLWGSEYYCDHPIFPLDNTTVDLNTDMIGRIDPSLISGNRNNYIYVVGNDRLSSGLDPISKSVNERYTKLKLDYRYNSPNDPERIFYRSDHFNFAIKGVPVIFFTSGLHKDYHKPTDTVDKINFDLMEKRVRFIFFTAWNMANRDEMLKRDLPLN